MRYLCEHCNTVYNEDKIILSEGDVGSFGITCQFCFDWDSYKDFSKK